MAGQDIDQFMREMEVVHKKRETERAQDLNIRLSLLKSDLKDSDKLGSKGATGKETAEDSESSVVAVAADLSSGTRQPVMTQQQQQQQTALPLLGLPPPPLLFRPPPPPVHLRMPPPPPPRHGLRLPPGMLDPDSYKKKNVLFVLYLIFINFVKD